MKRTPGLEADGTIVHVTFGKTPIQCINASYGDNLQPDKLRMMGSQLIEALTMGTYETDDAKVTLATSVFRADFLPYVVPGFGTKLMPMIFTITHPDLGEDSDMLVARFTGIKAAIEASNKALQVELGMTVQQIWWGDSGITINTFDTAVPLAEMRL
jgi:hypothetical protein